MHTAVTQLSMNRLESRDTPSISASVVGGTLVVSGSATTPGDLISIVSTNPASATEFQVFDGSTQVGQFSVTQDIRVSLGGADDNLLVNFRETSQPRPNFAGHLTVHLGGGNDRAEIGFGGPQSVTVNGGRGDDNITFAQFGVVGNLTVNAGDGENDSVRLQPRTEVGGNTSIRNAEGVLVSTLTRGHVSVSNSRPMAVQTVGEILGDLSVYAGGGSLAMGSSVGGNVRYVNDPTATTGASLRLNGSVAGRVLMVGTAAADRLEVGPQLANVTLGRLRALLGSGDDTFTRSASATIGRAVVDGGTGTDAYFGPVMPTAQQLIGFEIEPPLPVEAS